MAYIQKMLSKKVNAGKSQVIFHVVVNRTTKFRYKTNVFVEPEYWSEKTNDLRIVTKATKLPPSVLRTIRMYGAELDELEDTILYIIGEFPKLSAAKVAIESDSENEKTEKYWLELALECVADKDRSELTKEVIEEAVSNRLHKVDDTNKDSKSIYEIGLMFLEKRELSKRREHSYNVMFRVMSRYEIFRTQVTGIEWHWDVTKTTNEDMRDFFDYFRHENEYADKYKKVFAVSTKLYPVECTPKHKTAIIKERGDNYVAGMQKKIKAFWHWMQQNGLATTNPFVGIEMCQEVYGTPYYLTIAERNKVAEHDFTDKPSLALQRDIFVFQCLIGCRVGDLYSFTKSNIVGNILIYTPHKTKDDKSPVTARIPLSERAQTIIERYDGMDTKGRLFPFISTQNYNESIKEVLKACEINRMVNVRNSLTGENEMRMICDVASSHMARRTFVGNAYKQVKDPSIVGKMSGHVEGSKAFSRYRDIDDDTLTDVIRAIQ